MITRSQYPSAMEVEDALARVYARPEFAGRGPPSWFQAITDAVAVIRETIGRLIADVLEGVGAAAASGVGRWLIVGAALLVVLFVLFRLARRNADAWRVRNGGRAGRASNVVALEFDAEYWDAEAERAIGDGRFRDAALAFYHAVVLRLDERGVLRFDAAKTPGDYRREAARHADASRALNGFLRLFEPLAWGRQGGNADTLERLRGAAAEAAGRG